MMYKFRMVCVQSVLERSRYRVSALASLDTDPEPRGEKQLPCDRGTEALQPAVLRPALVILGLGVLQQLSGQAVTTFYASHIFQVGQELSLEREIHASTQEAGLGLAPEDCALILGLTHLLSSLLSLVVRQLVGRRPLLLVSQAGMGLAMLATGLYLSNTVSQQQADPGHSGNTTSWSWLVLPALQIFTLSYQLGLGSLAWSLASELLPARSRPYTHTLANIASNLCWFLVTKTFHDIQVSLHQLLVVQLGTTRLA